jgi:histidinol-phosphate aminotransferase
MGQSWNLSRRAFGRAAASLAILNEAALAQLSFVGEPPPDAVMLNANENPLGPCPEALEAMTIALKRGGRYMFEQTFHLSHTLAEQESLPDNHVQSYAGSSDPLHRVVLAFCSPTRAFIVADPGYEAGERAASFVKAPTHKIPLTKTYAHDVKAMLAAAGPNAGVFYVCNPNNPTGTLTPREDIEFLLANKPAGSIVLIDEAYIHFSGAKPCTDLVKAGKDVIVLRTFSKIYGMAGLRAGAALARPDLLQKLSGFGTGYVPTTGMSGARASLLAKDLVPQRKAYVQEVRESTLRWLASHGHSYVPSVSNKFMVDVKRPARPVVQELARRKVYVGRVWPIWPTHMRVTIGTREEMDKFIEAFAAVMS